MKQSHKGNIECLHVLFPLLLLIFMIMIIYLLKMNVIVEHSDLQSTSKAGS